MKEPLEFSRLVTASGEPVAKVLSDFRVKMDTYDLADPPAYHADHRELLLISQEFANVLAASELSEKLMTHNWDGKPKLKIETVRILSREFAVVMTSRAAPKEPPNTVLLADVQSAEDWAPTRFYTPAARFDPKTTKALGSNYYAVGPLAVPAGRKQRIVALGYSTRAIVVQGLELGDVWPLQLPARPE